MRMASIGGFNGPRGSLFHGSATDSFRLGSPANPTQTTLGASGQTTYDEAKKQVAIYDSLMGRTKRIANKQSREAIVVEFGLAEPDNKDKSLYMRNATAGNIAQAESYTPVNYYIFEGSGPAKNRPGKLKSFNSDFSAAVKYAEDTYGSLPEPVVIERVTTTTVSETPGWVLPVTIGAVGIAALAAFGVFSGK
jgi:hypothetical protein